jgi:hypothetical protein
MGIFNKLEQTLEFFSSPLFPNQSKLSLRTNCVSTRLPVRTATTQPNGTVKLNPAGKAKEHSHSKGKLASM